jgi:hypothetical protein
MVITKGLNFSASGWYFSVAARLFSEMENGSNRVSSVHWHFKRIDYFSQDILGAEKESQPIA